MPIKSTKKVTIMSIENLFSVLSPFANNTILRQLIVISEALLCAQGKITMSGISRWSGKGGSYRTIQRFFNGVIHQSCLQWALIKHYLLDPDDVILLAGDETTITKSGKKTFGLGRFFSSIYNRSVPGLFQYFADQCKT